MQKLLTWQNRFRLSKLRLFAPKTALFWAKVDTAPLLSQPRGSWGTEASLGLGECRICGRFPVIPGVDHLIILGEASLALQL